MFAKQLAGVQGRVWVQMITNTALNSWSLLPCLGKKQICSWRGWCGISLVIIPLTKVMRAHLCEPDSVPPYSGADWVQWFRINCNWDTNLTRWVKFQDSSCIQAQKSLALHFPVECLYWFNAQERRKNISLAISATLRTSFTFQNYQINSILGCFI